MNTAKQVGGALRLGMLIALAGGGTSGRSGPGTDHGLAFLAMAAVLVVVAALALALPPQRDGGTVSPRPDGRTGRAGRAPGRGRCFSR